MTGQNMDLTPTVRRYVERKLSKLNRHLPNIIESRVEIVEEKTKAPQQHFLVRVTLAGSSIRLHGEERGEDLFTAIDRVEAIMDRQIERYKGKHYRGRGDGRTAADVAVAEQEAFDDETGEIGPVISRRKTFVLVPMDEMEALEQLQLLGHENFFLFFNANTNAVNVLYRRRDGTYGLIEPEIA